MKINMTFKLWSELNTEAVKGLKPDFGLRSWKELSHDEKYKIWKYLEKYFFNKDIKHNRYEGDSYEFYGESEEKSAKELRIMLAIHELNQKYKAKSYAQRTLENLDLNNMCLDFYSIFIEQEENVVLELLSLYSKTTIEKGNWKHIWREEKQTEEQYKEKLIEWNFIPFDEFTEDLNEVFSHFGVNLILTRLGFIPRQEEKIKEDILEPVIKSLSHPKWREVNIILFDAFSEYRKNTPQGFSNCITNVVSAVQAFLQILVNGKTGSGDISKLISQAQTKALIPNDLFTKEVFDKIESVLMKERQETGVAHPKKEYATNKNARMVLNLAMIFFQHCL
jgi:hypothetical protein